MGRFSVVSLAAAACLVAAAVVQGAPSTSGPVEAKPARSGPRTLVIASKASVQETHSKFLANLKGGLDSRLCQR
jgi:hypothetical protein